MRGRTLLCRVKLDGSEELPKTSHSLQCARQTYADDRESRLSTATCAPFP